jgi:predicted nucleic acid-binding protein
MFRSCGVEGATNADAMAALEQWLVLRQVAFVEEPPGVMAHWARLAAVDQVAPKRWMDAYLAAVAIAGGWRLISFDRDFRSFQPQGLDLWLLPPAA